MILELTKLSMKTLCIELFDLSSYVLRKASVINGLFINLSYKPPHVSKLAVSLSKMKYV